MKLRPDVSKEVGLEVSFAAVGQESLLFWVLRPGWVFFEREEFASVVAVERLVDVLEREDVEWDFWGWDIIAEDVGDVEKRC